MAFEHYIPDSYLHSLVPVEDEPNDEWVMRELERSYEVDFPFDQPVFERVIEYGEVKSPVFERAIEYGEVKSPVFERAIEYGEVEPDILENIQELPMQDQANIEATNDLIDSFADQGFDAEHGVDDPVESDWVEDFYNEIAEEVRERRMAEDIIEDMEEKKDYAPRLVSMDDHKYDEDPLEIKQGDIRERVGDTPRRYDEDSSDDPSAPVDWGALGDAARRVGNILRDAIDEKGPEGKEVKINDEDLRVLEEEKKFEADTIEEKLNIEPFENENISVEILENTVLQVLRDPGNIDTNSSIRNNLDKIMRRAVNDIYKIENKNERIDKLQGLLRTMGIAKNRIVEKSDNVDLPLIFEQLLDKWYPSLRHLDEKVDIKSMLEDPNVSPHLSNFDLSEFDNFILSESKLTNDKIDEIRRAFSADLQWIDMTEGSFESKIEPLRDYINDNVKNDILREILLRDVENRFEAQLFRESNIHPRLYSTQPLDKYRNLELTSGILENLYDTVKLVSQKPQERPRQRINKDIINLLNDELVRYDIRDIDTNELLFINYNYEDDEKKLYENLEGVLEKLEDAKGSRQARFTYTPVHIRLQPNEKFQEQVIKSLQEIEKKILEPKKKLKLLKSKIHGYKGKFLKGSLISSERGKIKKDGSREAPLRHILIDENSTLEDIARISNAILAEDGELLDNNKDFIMLIQKGITPIGEVYNAILSELHKHHGHSFTITFNPKSDVGGMFLGGGINIFTKEIPDQLHDITGFFPREGEISVGGNISNINNNLPFHIKKLLSTPLFGFTNYQ